MEDTLPTEERDHGFTLIELLIAIVVVGILSAVAIVGIAGLTNSGQSATCQASLDAARTASAVSYANSTTNPKSYPATFTAMTGATPPVLVLASGVTENVAGTTISNGTWTITLVPGTPNTFTVAGTTGCA